MKMSKEILTFGNIEIEKNKFYRQKTPFCGGHGGGGGGVCVSKKIYFG